MENKLNFPSLPDNFLIKEKHGNYMFVLGAPDTEMTEIERMLRKYNIAYQYAMFEEARVHPGNAYNADPIKVHDNAVVVLVECQPREIFTSGSVFCRIDHHNPGDPGFGLPPEQYWEASSLGQLYAYLGKKEQPSKKHLVIAARDHCRFKVKNCPGVTPEEVSKYGRRSMAVELGVHQKILNENIQLMQRVAKNSGCISIGSQQIIDLRKVPVGEVYSLGYLSLYEALADIGKAAIVLTRNKSDKVEKIALMGPTEKETIVAFKTNWAPSEGLINIYGCEVRGYAGGYYGDKKSNLTSV